MDTTLLMILIMAALLVLVLIGWPYALRRIAKSYYAERYQPIPLQKPAQPPPPEHHLGDVPWISSSLPLSQSTSLQMMAAQKGIHFPRENFDFLMAYTYGASSLPGAGFSPFGTDPEIGFLIAAPFLGLKRCYYVTNDEKIFLAGLRECISKGNAVRLAVNQAALYGQPGFISHSVVLVGYDPQGFYYYETVAQPPATIEPGSREPGEKGLPVTESKLLKTVGSVAQTLRYPWRYALTTVEPGPLSEDLSPVWEMAGKAMAEEIKYGPRMGPKVVENLGAEVKKQGASFDVSKMKAGLTLAAKIRGDNAGFLRLAFGYDNNVKKAAQLLDDAASQYGRALEEINAGIRDRASANRLSGYLVEAAAAERKAGEAFLDQARQAPPA